MLSFVKTEFGKFGDVLAATKKKIESARNEIEKAGTRTRDIEKKLEKVKTLPVSDGEKLETELPGTRQICDECGPVNIDACHFADVFECLDANRQVSSLSHTAIIGAKPASVKPGAALQQNLSTRQRCSLFSRPVVPAIPRPRQSAS